MVVSRRYSVCNEVSLRVCERIFTDNIDNLQRTCNILRNENVAIKKQHTHKNKGSINKV